MGTKNIQVRKQKRKNKGENIGVEGKPVHLLAAAWATSIASSAVKFLKRSVHSMIS